MLLYGLCFPNIIVYTYELQWLASVHLFLCWVRLDTVTWLSGCSGPSVFTGDTDLFDNSDLLNTATFETSGDNDFFVLAEWRWSRGQRQRDEYRSILNAFIDKKDSYYSIHQIG